MRNVSRTIEAGKTVLIVLLAVSALFLAWRTKLFSDFFKIVPFFGNVAELMRGTAGTAETGGASLKEAARPLSIVITNEEGGRYGVKYDTDARNTAYGRTSIIFNEALGSSSKPLEIDEDEWRAALCGPGVFFAYATPVKLSVLVGWLGTRMAEFYDDASLTYICVAFGEGRSRVYYQDHESGLFYGADTASSAGKAQELGIYNANGALFAFETSIKAADNAPYMLILPGAEHPVIHAGAAGNAGELIDIVLAALGHSDEAPAILPESDGAIRCVGTQFNIRADALGRVTYHRTDSLPPAEERQTLDESEMIERARVIAADTIGGTCGDAEVSFESFEYSAGYYSVYFDYYIAGGNIHIHDDARAARVSFLSGMITDVELNFRHYALTDEHTELLPERQALAAANGEFMLFYSDTGPEWLHPFWH